MAVTDGSPEVVPPQPKKRNTKHYKAIAKAAEKLAADRLTQLEDARAVTEMWRNTNTMNYRLMLACAGLTLAGWLVVGWLAFWHYKP